MKIAIDELFNNSFVITINDIRYARFHKIFEIANLPQPHRFNGFNFRLNRNYYGVSFPNGTMLCNFSHCAIIRMAQSLNFPFVFIFEDDASPIKNCNKILADALNDIPDNADMVKLGWTVHRNNIVEQKNAQFNKNFITYGAHAYIVFSKYYNEYLNIFKESPGTDEQLMNSPAKNIYTTKQNIFIQYNYSSDNQMHNLKNQSFYIKNNININNYIYV